ncbi:MAG: hypothetical protein FJ388_18850, partial [Verrucomicrobia bacterium]|nr:hypothetical protein [Verrucomicrobiota bacterium]
MRRLRPSPSRAAIKAPTVFALRSPKARGAPRLRIASPFTVFDRTIFNLHCTKTWCGVCECRLVSPVMNHSRRSFLKWSAGAVALAAWRPACLWANEPFAGLTPIGKLKPRSSASIKASPLGVGYETLDRQHFDPVKTYQHAAQLGVKWARCQTGWARTEKTKGQYDFGWLDEVVNELLKIGIQPWFNLGYGNPLYTPKADETAVGWVPVFDEAAMDGWKNFTAK